MSSLFPGKKCAKETYLFFIFIMAESQDVITLIMISLKKVLLEQSTIFYSHQYPVLEYSEATVSHTFDSGCLY